MVFVVLATLVTGLDMAKELRSATHVLLSMCIFCSFAALLSPAFARS